MSLKELNSIESQKLFEMLANGAKPADIFETFAPDDNDIDTLEASVQFDPKDKDNIVYKMLRKLGKEVSDPSEDQGLLGKILKNGGAANTAIIRVGRDGSIDGFGFNKKKNKDNLDSMGLEELLGKITGLPSTGSKAPSFEELIDSILRNTAGGNATSSSVQNSNGMATLKIGRINIKGGNGAPVNIGIEDVEISTPSPNIEIKDKL